MPPWTDLAADWYARLVNGRGETYGLARRVHVGGGEVRYETWNGDAWQPTYEGAGYFTGIGGITDAVPVEPDEAEAIRLELSAGRPATPAPTDPSAPQTERFIARPGSMHE